MNNLRNITLLPGTLTNSQKIQHEQFKAAKQIALTIPPNQSRRAIYNGEVTNYTGCNLNGRMWVIGDTLADIQNPDATINGKPAREVFGEFTVMNK